MKKTAIAIVLDQSGSMGPIRDDTIGAVNTFIEDQRKQPGECSVSLTLFSTLFDRRYVDTPIAEVEPLTPLTYKPMGGTALLDATGDMINALGARLAEKPEHERPELVIFVIQTDGQENSSHEYTYEQVRSMIEHQREKYGWQFVFLGAGLDAVAQGAKIGINARQTLSYGREQSARAYGLTGQSVSAMRSGTASEASFDDNDIRSTP